MYVRDVLREVDLRPRRLSEKDLWVVQRNRGNWNDYSEAEPFRSTRLFLGIYGGLPFTWRKPHKPSLHPLKSTLLYSCTVFIVISVFEYRLLKSEVYKMMYDNLHVQDIIMHLEIILFSTAYTVTIATWMDVSPANRALDTWLQLGELYYRVTGRRTAQRRRTLETAINIVVAVFPLVTFYFSENSNPQMKVTWDYYPVILQGGTVLMITCFMWISYFGALKKMAMDINDDLKRDLNNNTLPLKKLLDYRKVWLAMRAMVDCAGTLNAPILILMLSVILIILIVYEMIVLFEAGSNLSFLSHLQLCLALIYFVNYMASTSSGALNEVKLFYTNILASRRVHSMEDGKQREVIGLYLVEKSRTLVPTYGGFVTVNRALVLTVISSVSTYLVVLMQFAQSVNKLEASQNISSTA